ncbi:MAG: carbohydrate kinase family protein [Candidatus Riflebacteria bacterium]|nr:carbohydrate kinase family protein [Candidatus Riflebacteria bacterium]
MHRVVVVGSATMDIKARMSEQTSARCAAGRIHNCPGGAARNIAENLARLSIQTSLFSALGSDATATEIITLTALAGVELSNVLQTERGRTATCLCILDSQGEVSHGIHDIGILEMITGDYLDRREDVLSKSNLVVVDSTLPLDSLRRLHEICARHKVPLALMPSSPFPLRVRTLLRDSLMVTPNRREAQLLTGADTATEKGLKRAAEELLDQGVRMVLITLGDQGVYYKSKEDEVRLPAFTQKVVDPMGASDAFVAGFLYGFLHSLPLLKALEIGQYTASLTLDTPFNVHPKLRLDYIHASVV